MEKEDAEANDDADSVDDSLGSRAYSVLGFSRWWQLAVAAGMMAAVSPYQYVWSSVEGPLASDLDVALPAVAAVFSLYVVFQSVSQFPAGWWRDRQGPTGVTFLAAALAGLGYVGVAYVTELWQLYIIYSLGAVGVGIVYTVAVNTALKWFPDRSGLTTGVSTMAFSAGSFLVVPYVRYFDAAGSYSTAVRNVGVAMLAVLVVGSILLRDPPEHWLDDGNGESGEDTGSMKSRTRDGVRSLQGKAYTTREVLATWQFWLMYLMFVAVAGADLLVIANVVGYAEQFGFAALVATASATLLPLAAGGSRIVLGEVFDRYQRKHVMAASFILAGAFRFILVYAGVGDHAVLFVAMVLASMFFSAPLYVYFPSLLTDYYGARYSSANYGVLYTAKIAGGVFAGSVAGYLIVLVGWNFTFVVGGAAAAAAGVAALALKPPKGSGLRDGEKSMESV